MADSTKDSPSGSGRTVLFRYQPVAVGNFELISVTFRAEADDEAVGFDVFGDDVEGGVISRRKREKGRRKKVGRKAVALSDGVEGDALVPADDFSFKRLDLLWLDYHLPDLFFYSQSFQKILYPDFADEADAG